MRWYIEIVNVLVWEKGYRFLGIGFDLKWLVVEVLMMLKGRYKIMRAYMSKKGIRGYDMMFRTCTI